jgi:hypothetical protein
MVQTDLWCMNVKGRIYGPYDTGQMRRFAKEKRLAYHSQVAPAGSREFREAFQFDELRSCFRPSQDAKPNRKEASGGGAPYLVVFGSREAAAEAEQAFLNGEDGALPISGTVYALRSNQNEDTLRDQLARAVPVGERVFVLRMTGARPSAAGVSLEELDRLTKLLQSPETARL